MPDGESRRRTRPAWGKIGLALGVVLALAAAWRFTPLSEYITAERVGGWARWVREMPWAPAVVIFAYTPAAFVMFPRPLLTLLTVIAFGPWLGFAYGMTGILLSAYATYYAGRLLKPATVSRLAGRHFEPVKKALQRHGFAATFAVRIVAVAPFVVEGIIAGAMRVGLWDYGLGTFLGMLPGVLATTVFGNEIASALESPDEATWWIAGAALLALVVTTWFVKRWFERQGA
jgi:phospholipase D1/2